jgi:hypothetical protein
MAYFKTKKTNLGKFWRALEWKILAYFMTIWNILLPFWYDFCPFVIVCGHLVLFSQFGFVWIKKNLATLVLDAKNPKLAERNGKWFKTRVCTCM